MLPVLNHVEWVFKNEQELAKEEITAMVGRMKQGFAILNRVLLVQVQSIKIFLELS